jgi:hypothetical protein
MLPDGALCFNAPEGQRMAELGVDGIEKVFCCQVDAVEQLAAPGCSDAEHKPFSGVRQRVFELVSIFSRPEGLASVDEDFKLGGDGVKIDWRRCHHQIGLPQQPEDFR